MSTPNHYTIECSAVNGVPVENMSHGQTNNALVAGTLDTIALIIYIISIYTYVPIHGVF